MKPQQLLLIVLALGCGLAAMMLTRQYLNPKQEEQGPDPNLVPVVVAKQDIKATTKITQEMIEITQRHKDLVHSDAVTKLEDVVGKSAHVDIFHPEPVLKARLSNLEGILAMLSPGMVAVTVPASVTSMVGGFIQSGSRVDVLLTVPAQADEPSFSKFLLHNVRVLAFGSRIERGSETGPTVSNLQANSVTFEATREQAALLSVARNLGELSLTLGGAGDAPPDVPVVVSAREILRIRPDEPAPPPPAPVQPVDPDVRYKDMIELDYEGFKIRLAKNDPMVKYIQDKARKATPEIEPKKDETPSEKAPAPAEGQTPEKPAA